VNQYQPYSAPAAQDVYRTNAPPYSPDDGHLSALAICHFVYAGLLGLGSLFGLLYVAVGVTLASTIASHPRAQGAPDAAMVGTLFAAIGGVLAAVLIAMTVLMAYSGRSIQLRKRWTFSFVMACLACLSVPLGTVLGVFTMLVLLRPSVKEQYDRVARSSA
jgi:hypothetical protein